MHRQMTSVRTTNKSGPRCIKFNNYIVNRKTLVLSVYLSSVAVCIMLLSVCVLLCLSVFLAGLRVCVFIFYGPCCLIQINIYLSI